LSFADSVTNQSPDSRLARGIDRVKAPFRVILGLVGKSISDRGPVTRHGAQRQVLPVVVMVAVCTFVLNILVIIFVRAEHYLYHADLLTYWSFAINLAAQLVADPVGAIFSISASVAHRTLNLLPATPVAMVLAVVGSSRLAYILTVLNLYGVAAVALVGLTIEDLRPNRSSLSGWWAALAAALALLIMSPMWRPMLIGYLGIGGVAIGAAILLLYLRRPAVELSLRELALIGFLVALLTLFRRWYSFWTVAFCVTVATEAAITSWRGRASWRDALRSAARAPAVIGATTVATLLVLALPAVLEMATTDYAGVFSAYKARHGMVAVVGSVVWEQGLLFMTLATAAAASLIAAQRTRRLGVFLTIHAVLTFILMRRVQDHSPHHWYLYTADTAVVLGLAFALWLARARTTGRRAAVAVVLLGAGLAITSAMYCPPAGRLADAAGRLVSAHRARPVVRDDLDQVRRLLGDLDHLTAEGSWIYVLGSTAILSDHVLGFANLSLGTDYASPARILRAAHVDRRDGFPSMLLRADLVVVGAPGQLHLRPEDQQVMAIPIAQFLDRTGYAAAFRRRPETYHLEDGVTAYLFERARPSTRAEIGSLVRTLRAAYPDDPRIYLP